MCILNGEFPYDCTVYSDDELRASEGHDAIYEFDSSEIDNEERLKQICDNIKIKYVGKHVWALYGSNKENEWICLQVASRKTEGVVSEILEDIECMTKRDSISGRVWRSKFHSNVFQPNYEYVLSDLKHQKYKLMKENFRKLMFVAPKEEILGKEGSAIARKEIYQHIEVKYACNTNSLFWNAYGKEHKMVTQYMSKNN